MHLSILWLIIDNSFSDDKDISREIKTLFVRTIVSEDASNVAQ